MVANIGSCNVADKHKSLVGRNLQNEICLNTKRYGDRFPVSAQARVVAVAWILTGLVVFGILMSAISSSLTGLVMTTEYTLYNAKVL